MRAAIWAIPGFLGLPSDWNFLVWDFLTGVDLYAFDWSSLPEWAREFNRRMEGLPHPAILMGYSLGGRLALHALLDRPEQWQGAVIVSAHTGLSDLQERAERAQSDQKWAERFDKEKWPSLIEAWNGQKIFARDNFHFDRQEKDYERVLLAKTLYAGSLAHQCDLVGQIATLPLPILWITGSEDGRYSSLAQRLTFAHPRSRWVRVEHAGHRVPWSQPLIFSQLVQEFSISEV